MLDKQRDILERAAESEITEDAAIQAIKDVAAWIDVTEQQDLGFVLPVNLVEMLDENLCAGACVSALKGFLQIVLPVLVKFMEYSNDLAELRNLAWSVCKTASGTYNDKRSGVDRAKLSKLTEALRPFMMKL